MNAQELIASYEKILEITEAMLAAARAGDWERLTGLETTCRSEVDRLVALGEDGPRLPEPLRQRKAQIVRRVLEGDAEIRRCAEPWMNQLAQMMGHIRNERRLSQSYGTPA